MLCGGRGSAAAALDYAISKGTSWLSAMFGEAKSQGLLYKKIFKRINSERKTGENVSIWLRHDILPSSSIYVFCNENLLSDVGELERIATRVIQPEDISDNE